MLFDQCPPRAVLLMLNQSWFIPAALWLLLQCRTKEGKDPTAKDAEYLVLLYVNVCNIHPSSLVLRKAVTVLPNVFCREWMNTWEALGYGGKSSRGDYDFRGSRGLAQYVLEKSAAACDCLLTCPQQAAESHLLPLILVFSHFAGFTMQIFLK